MKRSKSSQRWLREHFKDAYVQKAQKEGYRGRAAYKLKELQKKDGLIKPGMIVVDLGAAPGGWSQVVIEILKKNGHVYALDILPMQPIEGVEFIQGDFSDSRIVDQLLALIGEQKVDLVLSDIAPNIGGIKAVDQARSMMLNEYALAFAIRVLKRDGNFLVKVFQGEGFEAYLKVLRQHFTKVHARKPDASRERSRETYILARGFKDQ